MAMTKRASNCAFSLIELLVVIAIIGGMTVASIPALSSFRGNAQVNGAILDLANTLESAKATAMANNTYVWVGFRPVGSNLQVCSMGSRSGRFTDLQSSKNLFELTKTQAYPNMAISRVDGGSNIDDIIPASQLSFISASGDTYNWVLQFNPSGEVCLDATRMSRLIEIGLKRSSQKANFATIRVSGLSGQITVLRP